MKKLLLTCMTLLSCVIFGASAKADILLAGWDFQTTANGGTAASASATGNPSPLVYNANFGSGTLFLNGTNGSSTWSSGVANPQVTSFGGTTVNAGTGFSTTTSGAASLALANSTANGFHTVFAFDMTGFKDLVISYATQRSATGFTDHVWAVSTDGSNWTNFDTKTWPGGTGTATNFADVGVVTLASVSGLDNVSSAFVRLTLNGATALAGNNRFDNIQFNVSAVPEPVSMLLLGVAGVGGLAFRRFRRKAVDGEAVVS